MNKTVLKINDSDTGESDLDVVDVPEGFSFQMGYKDEVDKPPGFDYISVIVDEHDAMKLIEFLAKKLDIVDVRLRLGKIEYEQTKQAFGYPSDGSSRGNMLEDDE